MKWFLFFVPAALSAAVLVSCGSTDRDTGSLDPALFADPPQEFQVDTWWHWTGNNITRDGIRKDLVAMHEAGIKRATILDVRGTPVEGVPAVRFDSPEWHGMFLHALQVADSLGMKIGVHNCAGWSTSGGPWVPVEKSNKSYVWTRTYVDGGAVDTVLARPQALLDYYEDYAVVSFPASRPTHPFAQALIRATVSGKDVLRELTDGNPKTFVALKHGDRVELSFREPYPATELATLVWAVFNWNDISRQRYDFGIETSADGIHYVRTGAVSPVGCNGIRRCGITPFSASYIRIVNEGQDLELSELELLPEGGETAYREDIPGYLVRLNHVTGSRLSDFAPRYAEDAVPVPRSSVTDLTASMERDGRLRCVLPEGEWCILRFGYTTTGVTNAPAMPEGTGLESDKLDKEATDLHFNSFVRKLSDEAGSYTGKTFQFVLTDSWECQYANWTQRFPEEFRKESGYDILSWLPALCGTVVDSPEATETFLQDYLATVAALVDRNYYHEMMDLCHGVGLKFHSEPIYGGAGPYPPLDIIRSNAWCDLPMFEFWANVDNEWKVPSYKPGRRIFTGFPIESSIFNGKRVIGSEAYTGYAHFSDTPQSVAPFGNAAFCAGINQMIMHSYVHQPLDHAPHLTLTNMFGGHFNRNNPWFLLSEGWFDYQARVQYVLQQGERVTDLLYYVGDQWPQDINYAFRERVPKGLRPNIVNYDNLDEAVHYPALVIPLEAEVSLRTEEKLARLEKKGVRVIRETEAEPLSLGLTPDIETDLGEDDYNYTHRRVGQDEVYFVFNQRPEAVRSRFVFRAGGCIAQCWDPEDGRVFTFRDQHALEDGRTAVELSFRPYQTYFVVFRKSEVDAPTELLPVKRAEVTRLQATLHFDPAYEAEIPPLELDALQSLTDFDEEAIRHFGGIVHYTLRFDLPEGIDLSAPIALDLGALSATASVWINGVRQRGVWHDGTVLSVDNLQEKDNWLEVSVGTFLRNRMIGDLILYGEPRAVPTSSSQDNLASDDRYLLPAGWIGPLSVLEYQKP